MTNDDKLKRMEMHIAHLCDTVRSVADEIGVYIRKDERQLIVDSCARLTTACDDARDSVAETMAQKATEYNVAHEDEGRGTDTRKADVVGGDEEAREDDGKFTMATRAKHLAMTMRSIMDVMAVENHDGLYARGLNYEYGIMRDKVKRIIAIGDYYRHVADELKRVGYGKTAKLFAELADELSFEKECADDVHWCRGRDGDNGE